MLNKNNKTAILLGASGLVGSFLLDILLDSEEYQTIIVFVRKQLEKQHSKLKQYVIDFDVPHTYKDLVVGDDLFCCLGTTIKQAGSQEAFRKVDLEYPTKFAQIAEENGIKQYLIITSVGADSHSSTFYLKTKGECEDDIRKRQISSISVFRPASLIGERKTKRWTESVSVPLLKVFSVFLFGRLKKYKPVSAEQVAKAMFIIAQNPQKGYNVYESDKIQTI